MKYGTAAAVRHCSTMPMIQPSKPLQLSPGPQGSVIRVVDIPPDSVQNQVSAAAAAAAFAEIGQAHAGTGHANARHKLMHRTETLDYGIVTEGEVWLVLDDEEVHLKRGDVVVQRGTHHAWSNRTEAMARMVVYPAGRAFRR